MTERKQKQKGRIGAEGDEGYEGYEDYEHHLVIELVSVRVGVGIVFLSFYL